MSIKLKTKIYDTVHKVWVVTCMAATVGSAGFLAYNVYNYFRFVKPVKKEMEERFKEDLLKEGRMLQDKATAIN